MPGVDALTARFLLVRRAGERVAVTGTLTAEVRERCVVSLDEFASHIEQTIDLVFAPGLEERLPAERGGRPAGPTAPSVPGSDDQVDPPDPIIDGKIDLGAIALEYLALGRDPYPRKPGARFEDATFGDTAEEASPFAALEQLKSRS